MQVRQGFIYDEDQKAVTKSIRDRISQVLMNRRNVKREYPGEEKKEKERLDSDEQVIKTEWDDTDKEASMVTNEAEKEKEDKEDKESVTELESTGEALWSSQNNLEGQNVIDNTQSKLEEIAECSHSPQGTIDEEVSSVSQDIATTEKVRLAGCLDTVLHFLVCQPFIVMILFFFSFQLSVRSNPAIFWVPHWYTSEID